MKKTITNKTAKLLFLTATACLALCASLVSAQSSLPTANNGAGSISLTGATDSNPDAMGLGSPLAASAPQFYSYDGGVDAGFVSSYVYGVGVDPLNTLGGYTFVYAVTNGASRGPTLQLGEFQIGSPSSGTYWGSSVELGYSSSESNFYPTSGSLDLESEVTFYWTPPTGGAITFYEVVCTSLQDYGLTTAIVGDGGGGDSADVSIYTPVAAPEPSTATLLLLPLGIVVFRAFRQARTAKKIFIA